MLNSTRDTKTQLSINSSDEIKVKKVSKKEIYNTKIYKYISKIPVLFVLITLLFYIFMITYYYIILKLSNKKINKNAISVPSLGKCYAIFLIIIIKM